MLPDFPQLKAELNKYITAKLRMKMDAMDSVVSQIKHFTQHEGHTQQYKQLGPEGKVVEEGFQLLSTEFVTNVDEIPNLNGKNLEKKLDDIAARASAGVAAAFYEKVSEASDRAGNTMNLGGKPPSPEDLLEMMDRIEVEFDRTGKPTTALVFHPDMSESFRRVAEQIENDPELKRRANAILERQRAEWSARESNRKLAD